MATRTAQLTGRLPSLAHSDWQWIAFATLLALMTGIASAMLPLAAFAIVLLLLLVGAASLSLVNVERGATLLLVGGATLLGKGWANLGIPGAVPLPITELLFIPLAGIALLVRRTRLEPRVLVPLVLFALLVAVRVVFDYPVWGIYAIRDTTAAIEAFILLVGYRAITRDGIDYWISRCRYLAVAVLIYGAVYPFLDHIKGPSIGLQRQASLFDPTGVKFSVIAFGIYFLAFGKGWVRLGSLGLVTGLLGLYQARTLYIMLPLAVLALGWARHNFGRILMQIVPALAIAFLIISTLASAAIVGTEGPVSTSFISSHLKTLVGETGPNSKTIIARQDFFTQTIDFVFQSPGTAIVGVGLGPDLTFGQWVGDEGQLVRNPHNSYLESFARTGFLGFGLWMMLLLSCVIPIAQRARSGSGPVERFCGWTFAGSLVYLGVAGAQPILAFPYGTVPLFFLLGMGLAASRLPRQATALPEGTLLFKPRAELVSAKELP